MRTPAAADARRRKTRSSRTRSIALLGEAARDGGMSAVSARRTGCGGASCRSRCARRSSTSSAACSSPCRASRSRGSSARSRIRAGRRRSARCSRASSPGTLLTWVLQLVVLTLLGMRTIADDKRSGGWELLLTAQVGEGAAVVGKWLAAVDDLRAAVAADARVPRRRRDVPRRRRRLGPREHRDRLRSARSRSARRCSRGRSRRARRRRRRSSPARSGSRCSSGCFSSASCRPRCPTSRSIIRRSRARCGASRCAAQLDDVRARRARARRGRVRRRARGRRAVARDHARVCGPPAPRARCASRARRRVLVAVIGVLAGVLALRHPLRWDVSAARRNSLDPETRDGARELPGPRDADDRRADARRARADLRRGRSASPSGWRRPAPVTVRSVDPATLPGGLDAAARVAGLAPGDLASNGGVVVELGGRRRVVDRVQLVVDRARRRRHGRASSGSRSSRRSPARSPQLASPAPITACATTGHGELPLEHAPTGRRLALVADRLRAEGMTVETSRSTPAMPGALQRRRRRRDRRRRCRRPRRSRSSSYVARGGGLLVAAASRPCTATATTLAATGLEGAARRRRARPAAGDRRRSDARRCASCPARCSSSTATRPPDQRGLRADARATLWFQPRVVVAPGPAQAARHRDGGELGRARPRARAAAEGPRRHRRPGRARRDRQAAAA